MGARIKKNRRKTRKNKIRMSKQRMDPKLIRELNEMGITERSDHEKINRD